MMASYAKLVGKSLDNEDVAFDVIALPCKLGRQSPPDTTQTQTQMQMQMQQGWLTSNFPDLGSQK